MRIEKLLEISDIDTREILNTWRSSVEATHKFLKYEDIENLIPQVLEGIRYVKDFLS